MRRTHLALLSFISLLLLIAGSGALGGCAGSELETGYVPRKIGASATQRRGYYASPFTREAQEAQADRDQELEARRPKPGY